MKKPIKKPAKKIIPLPSLKIYFNDLEYPHRIEEVSRLTGLSASAVAQMAIRIGMSEVEARLTEDLPPSHQALKKSKVVK